MVSRDIAGQKQSAHIHVGHLALSRVLHAPGLVVFLGGINLILIQWVLVREMTTLLLGTELVVLLVSVAYFAGLSLGYLASAWMRPRLFVPLAALMLALHLTLPIWFRLLVAALDSVSAYWAAFLVLPALTPFIVSAFYSILLPRFVDSREGQLPDLYALELLGSGLGVVALVLLGGLGLTAVYAAYGAALLLMLVALGARWRTITLALMLALGWLAVLPAALNWSNARWYEQLRGLEPGTTTLFSAYSAYQKVDVLQEPDGTRYLYLDGLLHFGTNRWSRLNVLMGAVSADLVHPESALVVGSGSMEMARFMAERSGFVTTVELDPVVIEASARFFADYNWVDRLTNRRILIDDAKHYVANTEQRYGLIATDVPAAFSIQTATLYSVPFYKQLANRLEPDGMLVVNLTSRFTEASMVSRRIAASLLAVFDDVYVVNSPSSRLSYAYVGKNLPFSLIDLQRALEANGETEFMILDRAVVEQIVGDARPISLDSMDLVLQMSADWVADRLTWR